MQVQLTWSYTHLHALRNECTESIQNLKASLRYIAVKLLQWLEICSSFGSSCFPIFIENALHDCSKHF